MFRSINFVSYLIYVGFLWIFVLNNFRSHFPVPLDCRLAHPYGANSFFIPPFTDGVFHSSSWLSDKFSSTAMCQTTSLNQDWLQNYTVGSIVSCTDIFLSFTCINKKCLNFTFYFQDKHRGPLISYLYAPMMVMIVANVFMFVWAAFNFYQRSAESSQVTNVLHNGQRYC
jgi:hypothetical protein